MSTIYFYKNKEMQNSMSYDFIMIEIKMCTCIYVSSPLPTNSLPGIKNILKMG